MKIEDLVKSATTDGGKNFVYLDVPGHENIILRDNISIEVLDSILAQCREIIGKIPSLID